ncbi:unnamed protein product [Kuraishia capsulata CBS 1993]|uniref:Peptidase M20 dimerisation domain-containing protein n=1 Tax=Kuraishia capsulata CBS 1993 TaxID=1382522 RepID=W6MLR3_9ASCO|nr:uncharacterized protein KUCA_T00003035001 [Kuraishia capsulata CBS 1993]CDK27058.1 unnamed protein product [Kuraishia capsulata CBS 1993]
MLIDKAKPGFMERFFRPVQRTVLFSLTTLAILLVVNSHQKCNKQEILFFDNPDALCPIAGTILPKESWIANQTRHVLEDVDFREKSAAKLGGAVKVPTVVFDDWKSPKDDAEKWSEFAAFHKYLEQTFATVYDTLKVDKINEYGLVFTWEGSNSSMKPILLTAHIDVVPVAQETVSDWKHPPFSGFYDGDHVWGRGSSDCKNLLVALLETLELLVADNFKPTRSIVVAFGYDEEASGNYGAQSIGEFLLTKYGRNSFYAILDEGSTGLARVGGKLINMICTGEKGYLDSVIELKTPGGHSSIPPKHTSIGIMADLIHLIEENDFEPALINTNPELSLLQCLAENTDIDVSLKKDILRAHLDVSANSRIVDYLSKDFFGKATIKTSQAVDMIKGGIKSNALPEDVSILVNHRISVQDSVNTVGEHIEDLILQIAEQYDLGLIHDGETIREISKFGYFNYTGTQPLNPAPLTPINGRVWETLTGTIRGVFETYFLPENATLPIISAPGLSTGNTDTKSYWKLTDNIYRWIPSALTITSAEDENAGIHSVNEHVSVDSHLQTIAFYINYLRIIDTEFDEEEQSDAVEFIF